MNRNIYIKKKIESCDVVSFDMFDTLIKRDVPSPSDVFDLVYSEFSGNKLCDHTKFRRSRENAERIAREKLKNKDVSLEDIYRFMPDTFSDDEKKAISIIEKKVEFNICKKNKDIIDIYNFAISTGKKVIITSDMYLPFDLIENILKNNGFIGYDNIFLSNVLNVSKSNGKMYEVISERYQDKRIVHIGDNIKSDVVNARIHGIKGICWKKHNNKLIHGSNKTYLSVFINNRIDNKNSYYYNFGYQCMGPLLFTFSQWLNKSVKKDGLNDLFFLARDGKIMKKSYDLLFKDENVKTHYLLASRQSYIVPTLYKYESVREAFSKMFTSNFINLRYLMNKLNVLEQEIDEKTVNSVDLNCVYNDLDSILDDNNVKNFLDEVFEISKRKSVDENLKIKEYFKRNNFYGELGIVDIGWFGNMQNALLNITNNDKIHGYYLGLNSKSNYKNTQNMQGFLFNGNGLDSNELYVRTFSGLLELLFTRYDVGSFKGFTRDENRLVPVYGENEYSNNFSKLTLKTIQDAAIDFIKDFKNSYLYGKFHISMNEGFQRLENFAVSPTYKDVYMFNKIHKNHEKHLELIDKKNALNYIINPKSFYDDLQSSWFAAYAYKTFKVKIPIARIYKHFKIKGNE